VTRRQLLALATAAPAAAAVTRAAPAQHFEAGYTIDLRTLHSPMTPFARLEALQQSLALGLISPDLVRQALDLDMPRSSRK
jgi:hypothetical protein